MDIFRAAISALAFVAVAMPASAMQFTMNFDGIPAANVSGEANGISAVLGYYNGDGRASSQHWDVSFNAASLAIKAGNPGNFPPSPPPASGDSALALIGGPVELDLENGVLLTGLSLYFDRIVGTTAPTLTFYLDNVFVDEVTLAGCASATVGSFCGWEEVDLIAEVTGKRINKIAFSTSDSTAVFDDITLSTTRTVQPVPEPGSLALGLLGLAMVSGLARHRVR